MSKERLDQIVKVITRHERAAQHLKSFGPRISEHLSKCQISIAYENAARHFGHIDVEPLYDGRRVKTHLYHALRLTDDVYGERLDADEVAEVLSDSDGELGCEHCLGAWIAVIEREKARRELGYARVAVRSLGRSLLKAESVRVELAPEQAMESVNDCAQAAQGEGK